MRQRLALLVELRRHLIEGIDETSDFVGPDHVHPMSIPALGQS